MVLIAGFSRNSSRKISAAAAQNLSITSVMRWLNTVVLRRFSTKTGQFPLKTIEHNF